MNGFVLFPDKLTEKQLVNVGSLFPDSQLDLTVALPHVTVLQAPFKEGFKPAATLKKFAGNQFVNHELRAHLGSLKQIDQHWLFLEVMNTAPLKELNAQIIADVEDWIDVAAAPVPTKAMTDVEQESYNRTGYRYNLEAYAPHFTVGVVDSAVKLPVAFELTGSWVPFRRLAFCEHGDHGQITRVLDQVDLLSSWD
jgi:hypothetical protein